MTAVQKLVCIIKGRPATPVNLTHLIAQPTSQGRQKLREGVEESSSNSCENLNPEGDVV